MGLYLPCGRGDAKLTRGGFNGEQCCGGAPQAAAPLPASLCHLQLAGEGGQGEKVASWAPCPHSLRNQRSQHG